MRERFPNDVFFGTTRAGRRVVPSIPAEAFFLGARPPPQAPLAARLAATPFRFGAACFLVGWAGVVFQAGFFQQVVFGAPVFEELAKLGAPLMLVAWLGARNAWARQPYALLSGAAFGVFEHYLTYFAEEPVFFAGRVAFHAATAGLSMAVFGLVEEARDPRARWVTSAPSTLLHWANNFAAILLGAATLVAPAAEAVAVAWSVFVTLTVCGLLVVALVSPQRVRAMVFDALRASVPRLGLDRQGDGVVAAPPGSGRAE